MIHLKEATLRYDLEHDLALFAHACLKVRSKAGQLEAFAFNRTQRRLDRRLNEHLAMHGRVRVLILKGRQMGISTYTGARYFHRVIHQAGQRCFILTHSDQATENLFDMVRRFYEHLPEPLKPLTGAASAKELTFALMDSGYKIGTAGTKDVGRSQTIQLFHGSEVARWPHASEHVSGIMQAVPDAPGSEIILESTANGFDPLFHKMWEEAQDRRSDYEAIFLPWYEHIEYARPASPDLFLTAEDRDIQAAYKLSLEQMAWRDHKIRELKSYQLFRQEYPLTAAEAFQLTGHDSFIPASLVLKARKMVMGAPRGPKVIGFDPAWTGGDRHSMCIRQGRKVVSLESKVGLSVTQSAGWAARILRLERPVRMFIDVGGVGAGVYDILMEQGFDDVVRAVNFGSAPLYQASADHGGPANRRAEMWQAMKDWLEDEAGASIPDTDTLQADLCGPAYSYNSQSQLLLESKEHMRKRDVQSPDEGDALALTFAEPIVPSQMQRPMVMDRSYIV